VTTTLETMPADATHWSTRSMAKASGVSVSTVHRIWRAFSLQPHRSETCKLSADPPFVEKVRDIVGLYLDPPARALVLCVDEKTEIQALDRTQPLLPMRPGQADGPSPPTTSWRPSSDSADARPTCSPDVDRNFRIGTLVWAVLTRLLISLTLECRARSSAAHQFPSRCQREYSGAD
jgi:hypothetical protein